MSSGANLRFLLRLLRFVLSLNDVSVSAEHEWCLSTLRGSAAAAGFWRMSAGAVPGEEGCTAWVAAV